MTIIELAPKRQSCELQRLGSAKDSEKKPVRSALLSGSCGDSVFCSSCTPYFSLTCFNLMSGADDSQGQAPIAMQ